MGAHKATLEVTIQPPALAIISPTPRAFTFPITDSPFSSPSHSPFELDLSPTPPPFRPASASSSSSIHHRRRKSFSLDDRRPKKGDDDYIKRPENAFILFRRKCCEDRQASQEDADGPAAKKQRQADLSKTISQQWKSLSTDERQYWENLAKEKKKEHEALYPNYVYRPQRARDKDGRPKPRKSRRRSTDDDGLSFIVPVLNRHHGRSASAPTPPPYQSIQVPNVYQFTPSCPASPSLLPMITRRSSHPDYVSSNPFDFHPNDLQSSEFLQSMFNMAGLPTDSLDYIDPVLLPPHHLSPSTTTSAHSSPNSPHSTLILPQDFSHLTMDSSSSSPLCDPAAFDLQMEMQLQQEYAQFAWTAADPAVQQPWLLADNDFDITAIPPIQLDVSKCVDPMSIMQMQIEYPVPVPESSSSLDPEHHGF